MSGGQLAYREALTAPIFGVGAAVAAIFALMCGLIGPYGTALVLPVLSRLPYCALAHGLHLVVAYAGFVAVLYLMRDRTELQTVAAFVLEAVIFSAPCAAITYAVYSLYADLHSQPVRDFRPLIGGAYLATVPSLILAQALLYHVIRLRQGSVAAPRQPVARAPAALGDGAEVRPPAEPDAFHQRLPEEVGRDVVYLKAAGHYVNVVTTTGTAIVLLRFRDAMAELGDRGMQVHRGRWVAHAHVAAVERRADGHMALRLTSGEVVPVSRPFRAAARQRYDGQTPTP